MSQGRTGEEQSEGAGELERERRKPFTLDRRLALRGLVFAMWVFGEDGVVVVDEVEDVVD